MNIPKSICADLRHLRLKFMSFVVRPIKPQMSQIFADENHEESFS
jgi:hypothetical protein